MFKIITDSDMHVIRKLVDQNNIENDRDFLELLKGFSAAKAATVAFEAVIDEYELPKGAKEIFKQKYHKTVDQVKEDIEALSRAANEEF